MSLFTAGPLTAASSSSAAAGSPAGSTGTWFATGSGAGNCGPLSGSVRSAYLLLDDCSFSIPSVAAIVGIIAAITRTWSSSSGSPTAATDFSVKLLIGGSPTGTDQSAGATWSGAQSYGGASNLWGTTPVYTDANGSGFGVGIAGQANGAGQSSLAVASATLTVYYTLPDAADATDAALFSMDAGQVAGSFGAAPRQYTAVPYRCLDRRLWLPGRRRLMPGRGWTMPVYSQTRRANPSLAVPAGAA